MAIPNAHTARRILARELQDVFTSAHETVKSLPAYERDPETFYLDQLQLILQHVIDGAPAEVVISAAQAVQMRAEDCDAAATSARQAWEREMAGE